MRVGRTWAGGCLALLVVACGSDYADLCNEESDCVKGNDQDVEACVARYEGQEEWASAAGCESKFEKWFDCVERRLDCDRIDGIGFFTDGDRCDDEDEKLDECLKDWRK